MFNIVVNQTNKWIILKYKITHHQKTQKQLYQQ